MDSSSNNLPYNENNTVGYSNSINVSIYTNPLLIALVHLLELALIAAVLVILIMLVCKAITKLLKPVEEEGQSSNIPVQEDGKSQTLVNGEDECMICLAGLDDETKVAVLKPCEHMFHVDCISKWVSSNKSCPLCRQDTTKLVLCTVQIKSVTNDSALDMV